MSTKKVTKAKKPTGRGQDVPGLDLSSGGAPAMPPLRESSQTGPGSRPLAGARMTPPPMAPGRRKPARRTKA